jgi:NAD(P)-dependent dehydrogenase (short-subunit alcohol dehydrogenase family)
VPVAVVTGAARGIGAAIAIALEAGGHQVVRLDRDPGSGVIACDVGDPAAVDAVARTVGPVDVLVNNAGQWRFAALEDVAPEDFDAVVRTNLVGTFLCTQAFGRSMLAAGRGAIVNVVSIAAAAANPMVGAYSASKAGVLALTRQTALEWGPRGVRANAVGPGLVPTPGTGTVYDDPEVRAVRAGAVPLRRLAEPQDVANVVAFLVSDAAAYVNGQVLYVDGGLSQALMTLLPRPAGVAGPSLAGAHDVVRRHLRAVERLDLTGMSADYALHAVLQRGPDRYAGREAIAGYFDGVPDRLAGRPVEFGDVREEADGSVVVRWRIGGTASGHDRFVVRDGWIVEQSVHLDGGDF